MRGAMKSEIDEVALQGIEFWSNVCDEELDLQIEASEAQEMDIRVQWNHDRDTKNEGKVHNEHQIKWCLSAEQRE